MLYIGPMHSIQSNHNHYIYSDMQSWDEQRMEEDMQITWGNSIYIRDNYWVGLHVHNFMLPILTSCVYEVNECSLVPMENSAMALKTQPTSGNVIWMRPPPTWKIFSHYFDYAGSLYMPISCVCSNAGDNDDDANK